jgi:hypothetical protein
VFRCPRAPFSISLSHYFSFRLKRSLVAARNTKEKINLQKRGCLLSHAHHEYLGAFMLCATVLTPMSANGTQCNHPSATWISQFSVFFKTINKQITNKKKQTKAKREHRPPKIKRRQSIPARKCVILPERCG